MGAVVQEPSDRMYSWWWEGHSNPKNSKWLVEDLTEMDGRVRKMIGLIEEDADSFARRAEMYYKKRPELIKLMGEFYRAYRGLAARYDHITGLLRLDLRAMAEAYPNHELPSGFSSENYHGLRRFSDMFIDFNAGDEEIENTVEESFSFTKSLEDSDMNSEDSRFKKHGERLARKSLRFEDEEVNQPEHESVTKQELEISELKTDLANSRSENKTSLAEYQEILNKLSSQEMELSHAKDESKVFLERAVEAEAEINTLKKELEELDSERNALFLRYQNCNNTISGLQNQVSESEKAAHDAETEAQNLTYDLAILKAEKEASLVLFNESVEKISEMEEQLLRAKEDVKISSERAEKAERNHETLMRVLVSEREAAAASDRKGNETVAALNFKLRIAEEDSEKLRKEIEDISAKCKNVEDRNLQLEKINQFLHADLESVSQKLTKQNENFGRNLRFEDRLLKSQSHEEQSVSAIEELRTVNNSLQRKIAQIKIENQNLIEVNLTLALTVKDLKAEISSLKETIRKHEGESELLVNQKSKLVKEKNDLMGMFKGLHEKHQVIIMQVESLGLSPDTFGSQFKSLHYENIRLGRICEILKEEKVACLQKLTVVDKLMEKNFILERSSSNLNSELDGVRKKVKELEEYCKSLKDENSVLVSSNNFLVSQLQNINRTLEKHAEERSYFEKSLRDANSELQDCRVKSRDLEDSCRFLESKISARDCETENLKGKIGVLDGENSKLKAQLQAYTGAFVSLEESVATLESGNSYRIQEDYQNEKEASSEVCLSGNNEGTEESNSFPDEIIRLNEFQTKIKSFEKTTAEREKHLILENSLMKAKLETAIKQLEELKSRNYSQRNLIKGRHNAKLVHDDLKRENGLSARSEEGREISTKEILLDETSECSSVGFSRASTMEQFDPHEIWEDSFNKGSIDLTMEKSSKAAKARSDKKQLKEHQRKRSHSFVDKEVTLDNMISRKMQGACLEVQDRKIVDRLDSDAQKLTKLHITVQELKKTMESTEKNRKATGIEYVSMKEQLEESEEAIIKLFNVNLRLKRSVETEAISWEETSALAFEEKKSITRRKVSDQARRMSDKIGRLQLEVQKLQFLLIKLDDQSKSRPKIKVAERKTRVLLRDYIYTSGTRARPAPKRSNFCACAQPLTKDD